MIKVKKIDDTYSIEFNENFNDKPGRVLRHGYYTGLNFHHDLPNFTLSMWYRILELEEFVKSEGLNVP